MVRAVVAVTMATILLVSCGTSNNTDPLASDPTATSASVTSAAAPTTTAPTTTSTTVSPAVVPAFAATPSEFEARIELFGELTGNNVGTFAPIQNSQVIGAEVDEHAVGYFVDADDRITAAAVFVPLASGQTELTTPAQLISIVATSGVDGDDVEAAVEVFRREVLDELLVLDSALRTFSGGPPFFQLTSAIRSTGLLFITQPPDGPPPPIDELDLRLSTLVSATSSG